MDTTFKTTVFGGFDKQDVVAYIEKAARESGERIAALEKERDELAAARLEWEREGETLRETSQELQRRCDLLEVELAEKRTAEEAVRSQSQELEGLRARAGEERLRLGKVYGALGVTAGAFLVILLL